MSILTNTPIPAGWYPDPEGSPQQRWWDGALWTDSLAPYRSVQELVDAATRATEAAQSRRSGNSAFTSAHDFNEQQARATQLSFQSVGTPEAAPARSAHAAAAPVMTQEAPTAVASPFTMEIPVITSANAKEIKALEAAVALHGIPVHDRDEFIPLEQTATLVAPVAEAPTYAAPAAYAPPVAYAAPAYIAPAAPVFEPLEAGTSSWATAVRPTQGFSSGMSVQDAYEHFASVPNVRFTVPLRATRSFTLSAFLIGLLPALVLGAALGCAIAAPELFTSLAKGVLVTLLVIATVLLAVRDRNRLRSFGYMHTASWLWVLLSPLGYLVARTAAVKAETGKASIAPLVVAVSVAGAIAAVLVTQPAIIAALTGASV